jgi:energy-coupling factor transporter ATP-binding protein EcfA2
MPNSSGVFLSALPRSLRTCACKKGAKAVEHTSTSGQVSVVAIAPWAERLKELGMLDKARYDTLVQALDDARRGRLEQPYEPLLTVLLFGPSGVGKSQLLNALAGEVIAPVHFLRPTTRLPTVYAHAAVQAERLFEYGATLGRLTRVPASFQRHRREELRHIVLIDAPDIDSHVPEHRAQVMQLLPAVDVVLYVVTPESYKNDRGWQTVLTERGRRAFAFIMNKWDREGKRRVPAGQADVDDDFLALLQQHGGYDNPLLFRVSAAYWVARHTQGAPDLAPAEGEQFPELQRWLMHALSTSRISTIQRQRRRALWGSLAAAVSAAQPAAIAQQAWENDVSSALIRLRSDGWQVLRPTIAARAGFLAHMYGIGAWPHSPGPFGLCLQGVVTVRNFLHRVGEGITAMPWPRGQPQRLLPPEPPGSVPSLEMALIPDQLVQLLEERLTVLEVQARQHGVPLPWLSAQWHALVAAVPARLGAVVDQVATAILARPFGRVRALLGRIVLTGMEVLLSAFLGLVVWRLGTAFVVADYLGVGFVAHTLALFGCLVFLGYVVVSWCFPRPEQRFRRQLESRLSAAWDSLVDEIARMASDFLAEVTQLHRQGQQLLQALNAEIRACGPELRELPAAHDPDTVRLFAPPARQD